MRSAHINNLYNTVFWALVQQGGQTTKEAHETLRVCLPTRSYFCFLNRVFCLRVRCPARSRRSCIRDLGSITTIFPASSAKGALSSGTRWHAAASSFNLIFCTESQQLPIVETDDDEGEADIKIKDSVPVRSSCPIINAIPKAFVRMTMSPISMEEGHPRQKRHRPRNVKRVQRRGSDYFIMTLSGMGSGKGGRICWKNKDTCLCTVVQ
jgi:hypothetical protein